MASIPQSSDIPGVPRDETSQTVENVESSGRNFIVDGVKYTKNIDKIVLFKDWRFTAFRVNANETFQTIPNFDKISLRTLIDRLNETAQTNATMCRGFQLVPMRLASCTTEQKEKSEKRGKKEKKEPSERESVASYGDEGDGMRYLDDEPEENVSLPNSDENVPRNVTPRLDEQLCRVLQYLHTCIGNIMIAECQPASFQTSRQTENLTVPPALSSETVGEQVTRMLDEEPVQETEEQIIKRFKPIIQQIINYTYKRLQDINLPTAELYATADTGVEAMLKSESTYFYEILEDLTNVNIPLEDKNVHFGTLFTENAELKSFVDAVLISLTAQKENKKQKKIKLTLEQMYNMTKSPHEYKPMETSTVIKIPNSPDRKDEEESMRFADDYEEESMRIADFDEINSEPKNSSLATFEVTSDEKIKIDDMLAAYLEQDLIGIVESPVTNENEKLDKHNVVTLQNGRFITDDTTLLYTYAFLHGTQQDKPCNEKTIFATPSFLPLLIFVKPDTSISLKDLNDETLQRQIRKQMNMMSKQGCHPLDAKQIMFTFNHNVHWIAVVVNNEKKTIRQYDSLPSHFRHRSEFNDIMSKIILEMQKSRGQQQEKYTSEKAYTSIQQRNGYDCGVFMLYFMHALATNQYLDETYFNEQQKGSALEYRYFIAKQILDNIKSSRVAIPSSPPRTRVDEKGHIELDFDLDNLQPVASPPPPSAAAEIKETVEETRKSTRKRQPKRQFSPEPFQKLKAKRQKVDTPAPRKSRRLQSKKQEDKSKKSDSDIEREKEREKQKTNRTKRAEKRTAEKVENEPVDMPSTPPLVPRKNSFTREEEKKKKEEEEKKKKEEEEARKKLEEEEEKKEGKLREKYDVTYPVINRLYVEPREERQKRLNEERQARETIEERVARVRLLQEQKKIDEEQKKALLSSHQHNRLLHHILMYMMKYNLSSDKLEELQSMMTQAIKQEKAVEQTIRTRFYKDKPATFNPFTMTPNELNLVNKLAIPLIRMFGLMTSYYRKYEQDKKQTFGAMLSHFSTMFRGSASTFEFRSLVKEKLPALYQIARLYMKQVNKYSYNTVNAQTINIWSELLALDSTTRKDLTEKSKRIYDLLQVLIEDKEKEKVFERGMNFWKEYTSSS
jgi:hypothetical protein